MHVLLVEDSCRIRDSLVEGLTRSGYAVDAASDGDAGLQFARHNTYDVIVLDLMLPGVDGSTILRTLRAEGNQTHVLVLTAKGAVNDRVAGLRDGADDYLSKPFAFDELLARIEALTRRSYRTKNPIITIGSLAIDTSARTVECDGTSIKLSRREYALLEYLAFRRGQVVSRQQIEDHLYGERNFPMSNAVDRVMCTLRQKIGDADARAMVSTRRGQGFILEEPPT